MAIRAVDAPPEHDPAPALTRGLSLLNRLGDHGPMSLEQLSTESGWPKSSVLRCLQSLERVGAVIRNPADRRFRAGLRLVRADEASCHAALTQRFAAALQSLASESGHTAELHAWDGQRLTLIDRRESEHALVTARARVGFQRDLQELDALTMCVMAWSGWSPDKGLRQWAWDKGKRRAVPRREAAEHVARVHQAGAAHDLGINSNAVRRYAVPLLTPTDALEGLLAVAQVCGPADTGPDPTIPPRRVRHPNRAP